MPRRVLFVTEGRDAKTIEQLAEYLERPWLPAENIDLGKHRHVAGLHRGSHRTSAQRAHHL
jgi:hypothetical protein